MSEKNDREIGTRLDNGEKLIKNGIEYNRYKLQPNKQAANLTLKKLAQENSHQVLAQADLRLDSDDAATAVDTFFDDLEADLETRNN